MNRNLFAVFGILVIAAAAVAQDVQVSRTNKTIAVTADESVTVAPEIAIVEVGFHNYGATQQQASEENLRQSAQIIQAMIAMGIPRSAIETQKLTLKPIGPETEWTPEMKRQRQFEAEQSWTVRVSAQDAQKVADAALKAGANEIDDVEWTVADPSALQAKASAAALAKARAIAEQMAKGLGAKLGDLVYASNRAPVPKFWRGLQAQTQTAHLAAMAIVPKVELFPQQVKEEATVHAVFAIE